MVNKKEFGDWAIVYWKKGSKTLHIAQNQGDLGTTDYWMVGTTTRQFDYESGWLPNKEWTSTIKGHFPKAKAALLAKQAAVKEEKSLTESKETLKQFKVLYHGSKNGELRKDEKHKYNCLYVTPVFAYAAMYSTDSDSTHGCVFEMKPVRDLNIFDANDEGALDQLKAKVEELNPENTLARQIKWEDLKTKDWSTVCFRKIENSIAAQAKAKVGDILQRDDGTKVRLNQGDINWAKNIVKEEPDMAEATVDETSDMDNPVFDTDEHPESAEVDDTDSDTGTDEEPAEDNSSEEENSEEESNEEKDSDDENESDTTETDSSAESSEASEPGPKEEPEENPDEEKVPEETENKEELETKEEIADARSELEDTASDVNIRDGDAFMESDAARAAIFKKYAQLQDKEGPDGWYAGYNVINPVTLHGACEGEYLTRLQFEDDTQCFIKYADADNVRSIQVFTEDGKLLIDGGKVSKNAEFLQGVNKSAFWKTIKNHVKEVDSCLPI